MSSVGTEGLTLADGTILPSSYTAAGHLTHAYATTVHKAQGATVDRAFLLGSDELYREAGYVGMSRGRVSNEVFVVAPGVEILTQALGTSRAQSMALDQLLEARAANPTVLGAGREPDDLQLSRRGRRSPVDDFGLGRDDDEIGLAR